MKKRAKRPTHKNSPTSSGRWSRGVLFPAFSLYDFWSSRTRHVRNVEYWNIPHFIWGRCIIRLFSHLKVRREDFNERRFPGRHVTFVRSSIGDSESPFYRFPWYHFHRSIVGKWDVFRGDFVEFECARSRNNP